jgi:hypothetical protein
VCVCVCVCVCVRGSMDTFKVGYSVETVCVYGFTRLCDGKARKKGTRSPKPWRLCLMSRIYFLEKEEVPCFVLFFFFFLVGYLFCCFVCETGCYHKAQANSKSSCLCLSNVGIVGLCHHAWLPKVLFHCFALLYFVYSTGDCIRAW